MENITDTSDTGRMPKKDRSLKKTVGLGLAFGMAVTAGAAGASWDGFRVNGGGGHHARVACSGGIAQLGHVINEDAPIFEGDPETHINLAATIDPDGYLVEELTIATHTGTHFDAPGHFIEGGRLMDDIDADEFIWPAYIIDVRDRMADEGPNFQLTKQDIKEYEWDNERIKKGSMVIIRTGLAEFYGTEAYFGDAPGFSGDAVQWLVDRRNVSGIGSDNFGPDATSDTNYDATYTILSNDRFALPGLTNLDAMSVKGDVIIAAPVRLEDGSGHGVNPLACLGS